MSKPFRTALASAVIAAAPLAAQTPARGVESLAWMQGSWAGEKDGVAMEEMWTAPRGGALLGIHRDVKNDRMVSWEFLRIEATDAGIFYFASPRSAPPTSFKLVESSAKRAVFENKQHDFPQRISYWLDGAGLHARIEGPQGGKTVSEEWVWPRAK
jgi:hypothetical protein